MARAWHLMSRPQGLPTKENFALKDVDLPSVGDGMIRVRNKWLSVDPYMRGRMNDVKSYVPPFQVGEPMDGGAIGEVVESKAGGLARRGCNPRPYGPEIERPRVAPRALPWCPRRNGNDRLFRPARRRPGEAQRHRLRVRRGRRRRLGGRPDREGEGHDRGCFSGGFRKV